MLNFNPRPRVQAIRLLAVGFAVAVLLLAQSKPSAEAAPRPVSGGSLSWGIKASFRTYITGNIAKGAITVGSGGSLNGDGTYRFPVLGAGSYDSTGNTTVSFGGSVHFTGHAGQLDLTVSNLRLQMAGGSATLLSDISSLALGSTAPTNYPGIALASLTASAPVAGTGTVTWSNLPAVITSAGVAPFGGFYTAGTPMDPATIVLNVAADPTAIPTATRPPVTATTAQGFLQSTPTTVPFSQFIPTPTVFIPQTGPTTQVFGVTNPAPSTTSSGTTQTTTTSAPGTSQQPTSSVAGVTSQNNQPVRPPVTGDAGLLVEQTH